MKASARNRIIIRCILCLCLFVVSGLATTVCALASTQAAHHCCDGTATGAAAESSENDCHCPACTPAERSAGRPPFSLVKIHFNFPVRDFTLPRSLRSAAIDYPPEFI